MHLCKFHRNIFDTDWQQTGSKKRKPFNVSQRLFRVLHQRIHLEFRNAFVRLYLGLPHLGWCQFQYTFLWTCVYVSRKRFITKTMDIHIYMATELKSYSAKIQLVRYSVCIKYMPMHHHPLCSVIQHFLYAIHFWIKTMALNHFKLNLVRFHLLLWLLLLYFVDCVVRVCDDVYEHLTNCMVQNWYRKGWDWRSTKIQ